MRRLTIRAACGAIVLLAAGLGAAASPAAAGSHARNATVDHVIDGDTIELRSGEHVRLIGIDTPETQYSRFGAECFGAQASAFAERLLHEGDRVRLVFDVERHDRYDRLLAYVYRASDELFVNAELVEQGYAYVLTVPPNVEHADELRELAREARADDRGVWSACAEPRLAN